MLRVLRSWERVQKLENYFVVFVFTTGLSYKRDDAGQIFGQRFSFDGGPQKYEARNK